MMQKISFTERNAQQVYEQFLSNVSNVIKDLPDKDRNEIVMEINSHIYEGMESMDNGSEIDRILSITSQLGDPHEFLKPIVTERQLDDALKKFKLGKILSIIYKKAKTSVNYAMFFILYLFSLCTFSLIFFKLFFPANTGLFYSGQRIKAFGFALNISGTTEVLGGWFYLVVIAIVSVFYGIITLLLRATRRRTKHNFV
ncbi:hypothetical protein [Olivibacter sp. XZL3]|uniref:HAAS signaling domain-containing protein n=1 Tax=Olivibacter sp. XZL3 TaxID=1735116 RepID=UPI001066394A|nr:hypothetical protein [Olivibacter sp. XZL3]